MSESTESRVKVYTAADPDDERKPDSVTDLTARSWRYVGKKTLREFNKDHCTDLAAGLTYYAVLALFPGLLALVSLLGLFGEGTQGTGALMGVVRDVAPSAAGTVQTVVTGLSQGHTAGFALFVGLAGAIWSASGYIRAFGRAMNRIYEIDEGRPFYKLRPQQLGITVGVIVIAAAITVGLVVTGPLAASIGSALHIGGAAVTVWNVAKWPIILVAVIVLVAVLYYATPNIRQPKFHWVSVGAALAVLIWVAASAGFAVYVANFSHYNKTYGSLAGIIVFLLWLWITNVALLVGAEINSEIERGRQLQAGIAAQDSLQLPPRDTEASDKTAAKDRQERQEALTIRAEATKDPETTSETY